MDEALTLEMIVSLFPCDDDLTLIKLIDTNILRLLFNENLDVQRTSKRKLSIMDVKESKQQHCYSNKYNQSMLIGC